MNLIQKYHEGRVRKLHDAHPNVDLNIIRGDYYIRLQGYTGMELFVPVTEGRTIDYDTDLIMAADWSLPARVKRFLLNLGIVVNK